MSHSAIAPDFLIVVPNKSSPGMEATMRRVVVPIILVLATAGAKDCDGGGSSEQCVCWYNDNPITNSRKKVVYDINEAECQVKDDLRFTVCSMQEVEASVRHPFAPQASDPVPERERD